jgi:hypothetical protein
LWYRSAPQVSGDLRFGDQPGPLADPAVQPIALETNLPPSKTVTDRYNWYILFNY